ncbi:MAG: DegT/DnrJ/EryC1/StrS family aminotransferase [bacterium]
MIPVCEPTLTGREREYVEDCLATGWISSAGGYIERFEAAFAAWCGVEHCVCCCNGTAALHLALAAIGTGPGDEVIVPSFTMIATCNAVIYTGATPVLVDSEPGTWNVDCGRVAEAVSGKTRAIIVVHTYGHPADMDAVNGIARERGIAVIEDAAEAHGAEYRGRRCGGLGTMGAFSFYANKIITTGEGGAVTTNDARLAERARKLRNHCFGVPRFVHDEVGFNYRMTNVQAAIGLAQLENAERLVESRRRNAAAYNGLLAGARGVRTPPEAPWVKNVYWMYGVLLDEDFPATRDGLMEGLSERGIETRAFFHPMHLQPAYGAGLPNAPVARGGLKVAEMLGARGLYLPSSSHLTEEQIETVAAAVREIAEGKS